MEGEVEEVVVDTGKVEVGVVVVEEEGCKHRQMGCKGKSDPLQDRSILGMWMGLGCHPGPGRLGSRTMRGTGWESTRGRS